MSTTTEILLSLFFVMFIGFATGRLKLFNDEARLEFSRFVFYVATAAVIFTSVATIDVEQLSKLPGFVLANSLLYMVVFAVLYIVLRMTSVSYKTGGSILYTSLTPNLIFLGLPFIAALYGREGVLYVVAMVAVPMSVSDLAGFYVLSKWRNGRGAIRAVLKDFITNPLVIATLAGAALLFSGLGLWYPLQRSLDLTGSGATGLALFSVGLFLASSSWRRFQLRTALIISVIKLLLLPLAALAIGKLFGLGQTALAVTVLLAAMPSAVFCTVVATEYKFDEQATVDAVLLSSLLFLLTSLFWVYIV